MKSSYILIIVFIFSLELFSQTDIPTDFLSKDFHAKRREILRGKMPNNSIAVIFSNPIRNRSNDVDYVFHQDPNFYYLTGYREPNGVLLLFSNDQIDKDGTIYNEILFVQERDVVAEMWSGKRIGVNGVKNQLGFKKAENAIDFINSKIDFTRFFKVFIDGKFKDDYRNTSNSAEIYDLVNSFKEKSGYNPESYISETKKYLYTIISTKPIEDKPKVVEIIKSYDSAYPEVSSDLLIQNYMKANSEILIKDNQKKVAFALLPTTNIDVSFITRQLAEMREIKTVGELNLLKKAVRISAIGQIEVMKAVKPHMSETEIQGIHEFIYKKYGVEYEGYPSIVGGGNNGCVLHYIENNKTHVGHDLVLMDLGAEYRGYTADVTRTIPADGTFSKEQKFIYDLVYKSQEAGIKASIMGADFNEPTKVARKIINRGLYDLGIIKSPDSRHQYFPHGASHYIGLDVHDPGTYGKLRENSVITVEPGIYIPKGSDCDEKWWGIAVRIEDDILITKEGPVNLSKEAPRKSEEIEKMMKKSSFFGSFLLPNIDE